MPINLSLIKSPMNWILIGFAILLLSLLSKAIFGRLTND